MKITTNIRIEGKKLSELMLPPQLRTKGLHFPNHHSITQLNLGTRFLTITTCWVLEDFTTYFCWFNIGATSEDLVLLRKIEENRLFL
ncbi:hypothetical protein Tco_0506831 [Tanacetum coccineum]